MPNEVKQNNENGNPLDGYQNPALSGEKQSTEARQDVKTEVRSDQNSDAKKQETEAEHHKPQARVALVSAPPIVAAIERMATEIRVMFELHWENSFASLFNFVVQGGKVVEAAGRLIISLMSLLGVASSAFTGVGA